MAENYSGNLYIVAAPSGGGKTSLVRHLVTTLDDIVISISHTTRAMRPGENNGVDYFFVNEQQFLGLISEDELIEMEDPSEPISNVALHLAHSYVHAWQHIYRAKIY